MHPKIMENEKSLKGFLRVFLLLSVDLLIDCCNFGIFSTKNIQCGISKTSIGHFYFVNSDMTKSNLTFAFTKS